MLGSSVAHYWYRHHQQERGTLTGPERIGVESELAELSAVQTMRLWTIFAVEKKGPAHKYLLNEIERLEDLKLRSNAPEIKSLIDLERGLAYVQAAMVEGQDNNEELAKKYMQSAQGVFKSLGWQNYSEEALKAVAKRELDKWP